MRLYQITENSTTAGSISSVSQPMMTQTRENVKVAGLKPVSQVMRGKAKKKGPYANSLVEGKVKELSMDLKDLTDADFLKKYKKTKAQVKAELKNSKVNEEDISEQDFIVIPGQGRLKKTGFLKHDPDKAEHEGETLKNSLHTIIRVATHLDKVLSTQDEFPEWVSEKIGATKSMMVGIMDYLLSAREMQHDPDAMEGAGVIAGGPAYEGKIDFAQKLQKNIDKRNKAVIQTKKEVGSRIANIGPGGKELNIKTDKAWDDAHKFKEGAKADRMVKYVEKSEEKAGKSKKEAENIAWATANKRGYLDNKNKKSHKG